MPKAMHAYSFVKFYRVLSLIGCWLLPAYVGYTVTSGCWLLPAYVGYTDSGYWLLPAYVGFTVCGCWLLPAYVGYTVSGCWLLPAYVGYTVTSGYWLLPAYVGYTDSGYWLLPAYVGFTVSGCWLLPAYVGFTFSGYWLLPVVLALLLVAASFSLLKYSPQRRKMRETDGGGSCSNSIKLYSRPGPVHYFNLGEDTSWSSEGTFEKNVYTCIMIIQLILL